MDRVILHIRSRRFSEQYKVKKTRKKLHCSFVILIPVRSAGDDNELFCNVKLHFGVVVVECAVDSRLLAMYMTV